MTSEPPVLNHAASQLALSFGLTEKALLGLLENRLERPMSLTLTANSTTMLSARLRGGVLAVRLHRLFLGADGAVIDEIVSYLKGRKSPMPCFRSFVRTKREELEVRPPKQVPLQTRGRHHDLAELFQEINAEYFGGSVSASITWGSYCPRRAVRRRTLGSYSSRSNTIRINPLLDRRSVPRFVVAFIVYHEMLHAALGTPVVGTRRSIHSREFRRRERLYRDYERAMMAWERGTA